MPNKALEITIADTTVATTSLTRIWSLPVEVYTALMPGGGDGVLGLRMQIQGFNANNAILDYYIATTYGYVAGGLTSNDVTVLYSFNGGDAVTFTSSAGSDTAEINVTQTTSTSFQYTARGYLYIMEET